MIIYLSMIGWIAFIYLIYRIVYNDGRISHTPRRAPKWCAFLVMAYIVFWVGIRGYIKDTYAYVATFDVTSNQLSSLKTVFEDSEKGPGFLAFSIIFKALISEDPQVFLFTIAIIQMIPIISVFRKHSESFFFSCFLYIAMTSFTWMMNGIRQFIPVAILFGCTDFLIERKWWKYLGITLILSTFHYTALIMIPIYWIVTSKPWSWKVNLSIIGIILCAVFAEQFTGFLEYTVSGTVYEGFTGSFAQDDGVNPLRVIVALVPVLLSLLCSRGTSRDNDPLVNVMINMSVLSAGMYFVGVFTSGIIIGRIPIYCSLYSLMLLPYLFNHYFEELARRLLYFGSAVGYFAYFYLLMRGYGYISDLTGLVG